MARIFIAYTDLLVSARYAPRPYVIDVAAFGYDMARALQVAGTMDSIAINADVRLIELDDEPTVSLVKTARTTIEDMRRLFASDPSEALYRAEAELPFRGPGSFIEFVEWASEPRVSLVKTYHGRVCVECGHLATAHIDGVRCPGGDHGDVLRFVLHLDDYAAGTPRVELNREDNVWDGVEMRWSDRALVHVLGDGTQVSGDYLFASEVI